MKRVYSSSLSLSSFTLVALAGFGLIVAGRAPARADDDGCRAAARASALAKTVTIERDTFGVPHVYGPTDASCVFGFIYAQAEDYFWQIEDSYLRSLGRAAEVYGDKSLPDDLVNRALEITRLSKEEYQNASPKTKEICQAIADGLNYYLAVNPQVKPRLITHFEPWHPLAFRRFILYQSFIYGKSGLQAVRYPLGRSGNSRQQGRRGRIPRGPARRAGGNGTGPAKHVGARRLQHVGRPSRQVGVGQSAHVHQSAPAVLRPGTVV